MFSRHVVPSKSPGINTSKFLARIASVTPLFVTLTRSPYQSHSKDFRCPLFSYSYALFCTAQSDIPCIFSILRTLRAKHPGWGMPLRVFLKRLATFDRLPILHLYSLLLLREEPCT